MNPKDRVEMMKEERITESKRQDFAWRSRPAIFSFPPDPSHLSSPHVMLISNAPKSCGSSVNQWLLTGLLELKHIKSLPSSVKSVISSKSGFQPDRLFLSSSFTQQSFKTSLSSPVSWSSDVRDVTEWVRGSWRRAASTGISQDLKVISYYHQREPASMALPPLSPLFFITFFENG